MGDEDRRIKQLEVNQTWLLSCTDEICYALCPDFIGTWQQRAKAAVDEAKRRAAASPKALPPSSKKHLPADAEEVHEILSSAVIRGAVALLQGIGRKLCDQSGDAAPEMALTLAANAGPMARELSLRVWKELREERVVERICAALSSGAGQRDVVGVRCLLHGKPSWCPSYFRGDCPANPCMLTGAVKPDSLTDNQEREGTDGR